ncbi:MAG: hypothetical protein ACOX1X_00915 [Dethiobacteria bacterium]|jgi:hypothetical protein
MIESRHKLLSLVDDFWEELDMRMEQVKIYYPIMEMLRRRKAEEFSGLVPELCFLTLAYLIYEGKLKHRVITFQNLEAFVGKALQRVMAKDLAPETIRELTAEILDGMQNGGRNYILNTYSFKQMEKGAFAFAYETVRRLNMEVQKKKDRKNSLLESLMYGRFDFGEAYNNYHRSIVMQFEEEAELFNTAVKNVNSAFNEYMERVNSGEATSKEIRLLP